MNPWHVMATFEPVEAARQRTELLCMFLGTHRLNRFRFFTSDVSAASLPLNWELPHAQILKRLPSTQGFMAIVGFLKITSY